MNSLGYQVPLDSPQGEKCLKNRPLWLHTCCLLSSHHAPLWRTRLHSLEDLHTGAAGRNPQAFSSPGSVTAPVPLLLTKQKLTTHANLGSCPLNSLQSMDIPFVPGRGAQLDAAFWTWSNECQMEWDNCLTSPPGCAPVSKGQLAGHHDTQNRLSWCRGSLPREREPGSPHP